MYKTEIFYQNNVYRLVDFLNKNMISKENIIAIVPTEVNTSGQAREFQLVYWEGTK